MAENPQTTVTNAYWAFWASFSSHASKAGYRVSGFNPKFSQEAGNTVIHKSVHHMIKWPARSDREGRKLDIVIQAEEKFKNRNPKLWFSKIQVDYYLESNGTACLAESIHYDYQREPDPAHPVFHMQFCKNGIKVDDFDQLSETFDFEVTANSHFEHRIKGIRIPTAQMNLPYILVGLAADHWPHERFEEFRAELFGLESRVPDASCDILRTQCQTHQTFRSLNWYYPA